MLHEYGIQTEDSTHRVHVDMMGKKLFIYKTIDGITRLPEPILIKSYDDWEKHPYRLVKPGWNKKIPTARGTRVFYKSISNCVDVCIPQDLIDNHDVSSYSTTSEKGRIATDIVISMMERGLVPFAITVKNIDDKKFQIRGIDLETTNFLIQVKYDYECESRGIFLQTHENNPYKMH